MKLDRLALETMPDLYIKEVEELIDDLREHSQKQKDEIDDLKRQVWLLKRDATA